MMMAPNGEPARASEVARSLIESFAAILFRRKWVILTVFASVLAGVVTATRLMSPRYESEMRILVKNERVDLLVTPSASAQTFVNTNVDESVINSEIELLSSADLLRQVVMERRLFERDPAESAD